MSSNPLHFLPKISTHRFPPSFLLPATLLPQLLPKTLFCITCCSLPPPSTREEAISQARSCLSSSLQKPLNNPLPILTRKLRKQRQPRFRVEIPIADDISASSLTALAAELFSDLPITKKGSAPNILLFWPSLDLAHSARREFSSSRSLIHSDIASAVGDELSTFADLAVFLAPEASILEDVRLLANCLSPKPVVLFNPKWAFEEEKGFDAPLGSFVGSFDVVYSFMGLEVRGLLSRRNGVLFKWAADGVVGGEGWLLMLSWAASQLHKVLSKYQGRPSPGPLDNVLENTTAVSRNVYKSLAFIRTLVATMTENRTREQ
ncbi:hypothetical protein KSP39_PZI021532 [Platanthera zijinensis]|uniref:DUF1995 domain-containing protein n=1 Tax=Platanthera zijinensis TaxID=2320716 RepID=A0AAP0FWI5_9ASPA